MSLVDDGLLGTTVGPYRLVELLGRGGMGRVYLGVHPEIHARVAIKVISEDAGADPEQVERFFAEARAVNMISHDGIVRVHDLVRLPGNRPAIVMELVDGRTLRDVIHAGALPIGGAVQVMIEVLGAVAAAHAIGIVHRDLKPDNIIISDTGRAKVLDFGIAKLAAGTAGKGPRTRTGALLGTPHYMSPEQIQGTEIDARSDLYSLGVVLFEMFSGQRPFDGATDFELMMAQVSSPPPSLRALRPDLPKLLEDVVMAALAKRKIDRFGSANAMANALHAASAGLPAEQWRSLTPHGREMFRPSSPPAPIATRESSASASNALTMQQSPTEPGRSGSALTKADAPTRPPSRRGMWIAVGAVTAIAGGLAVVLGAAATGSSTQSTTGSAGGSATGSAGGSAMTMLGRAPIDAGSVVPDAAASFLEPGKTSALLAPDYEIETFDAMAYLPRAQALARTVAPDAELTLINADVVNRAGITDLGAEQGRTAVMYKFVSPTRAVAKPVEGTPKNVRFERRCEVLVSATSTYRTLAIIPESAAKCESIVVKPRCTFAEVWSKAMAAGIGRDEFASLMVMAQPKLGQFWIFTTVAVDTQSKRITIADDCGVTKAAAKPDAKPDTKSDPKPAATADAAPPPSKGGLTLNKARDAWNAERDYSMHRFDPQAWISTADRYVRGVSPDARLMTIDVTGVHRDGHLDLDPVVGDGRVRSVAYDYASPTAPCTLRLVANSSWVTMNDLRTKCMTTRLAPPRCTLVQIWKRAIAETGLDGDLLDAPAAITWDGRGRQWSFHLMSNNDKWGRFDLDDRCP